MNKEAPKGLMEWPPILERITLACFKTKIHNLTIIQCNAPTEMTDKDKKEEIHQQLSEAITTVKKRDVIIVMGDMNAKIGPNNEGLEHVMGRLQTLGLKCWPQERSLKQKIQKPSIREEFKLEMKNRFSVLSTPNEDTDIKTSWKAIKNVYIETSEKKLGFRENQQ
jgi:polysaccharide deacetylase 2 family uncharacterized protein YibQ